MKHYNRMAEILFSFKDLVNLRDPSNPILSIGSILLSDRYISQLFPNRYNFYTKFIKGLKNPDSLYKFLHTTAENKKIYNELQNKLVSISKSLNNLSKKDKNKVLSNLRRYYNNNSKYNRLYDVLGSLKGGADYHVEKRPGPMKLFLNELNSVAPSLSNKVSTSIDDIVKTGSNKDENQRQNIDINKIKQVYTKYENIPAYNPDRLKINMYDRYIFIAVTFIIRFIALSFIYWGLNSNIVNNFKKAFIYYSFVYIIFFIFITALVNIIYFYPIMQLFSSTSIIQLPNLLYYFYIQINGMSSLLIHIGIIITLLFIPFILVMDKKGERQDITNITYDYKQKDRIYNSISTFSLVIWILTSIIALRF